MNKKGFTVVELIVSFTLAMTISVFLFQIVINLKNLYTNSTIKTELINIQSLVSRQMNENFKKGIISVDECGDRCYEFFYIDDTSDKLILSDDSIEFGNYKSKLPKNSYIRNETINISSSTTFSDSFDDSLLIINVPIYNENFKDEVYNIKIVYPYNSNENDLNFGIEFTMEPVGFDYTGGEQVFTVPHSGYYQLEVWGAQGGTHVNSIGGYGGYSTGILKLEKDTNIYIVVGGTTNSIAKGYNGGGSGIYNGFGYGCGGGGATHIAMVSGILSSLEKYKGTLYSDKSTYNSTEILIVAGGGGGGASWTDQNKYFSAGSGGGFTGTVGNKYSSGTAGANGTQTGGGTFGVGGNGSSNWSGGSGGGFYGGGPTNWSSGSGGSGYIGSSLLTDKYMYCYNCAVSDNENTKTYSTTNVSETPISQYAKKGNGYAKITYIGESLE